MIWIALDFYRRRSGSLIPQLFLCALVAAGCAQPSSSASSEQGIPRSYSTKDAWEDRPFRCWLPTSPNGVRLGIIQREEAGSNITYVNERVEQKLWRSLLQRSKWTTDPNGAEILSSGTTYRTESGEHRGAAEGSDVWFSKITIQFLGSSYDKRAQVWVGGKLLKGRIACTAADKVGDRTN
jgi:hypothetical protein